MATARSGPGSAAVPRSGVPTDELDEITEPPCLKALVLGVATPKSMGRTSKTSTRNDLQQILKSGHWQRASYYLHLNGYQATRVCRGAGARTQWFDTRPKRGLSTKFRTSLRETSVASTAVLAAAGGADFVLYGPLEHAEAVFHMVAMVNAAQAQVFFEKTGKMNRQHPLFKIP